jgi:hypothetical protein
VGITLVPAISQAVTRDFWKAMPRQFVGMLDASRTAHGSSTLTYLTDDARVGAAYAFAKSGDQPGRFKAWRISIDADGARGHKSLPWPSDIAEYEYRDGPGVQRAALIRGHRIAISSGVSWDTVAIPAQLFRTAGDTTTTTFVTPLSARTVLVEVGIDGACPFLTEGTHERESGEPEPCTRSAAFYDQQSRQWTIGASSMSFGERTSV